MLHEPTIIFENEHLLVVNKPAGLVVHGDGKTNEGSLADWLLKQYPDMKEVGEPMILHDGTVIYRPGIVHRLDRETSGVMVIAKTQESFENLKKQFQERQIHKGYDVIVWGLVKDDKGAIDRPIGRSRSDFRKWSAQREARGDMRPSITDYKVISRIDNGTSKPHEIPQNFTYLEAYPRTGRTHQIRVHLKAINHPVVCDSLYAANHPQALGLKRLALHARYIEVEDVDGKTHAFAAPQPADFVEALSNFTI